MNLELMGYDSSFQVDVYVDEFNKIIHILDLAAPGKTSLTNGIDINNNQTLILKKLKIDINTEWKWILYSPRDNTFWEFVNGGFNAISKEIVYIPFYEQIKRDKTSQQFISKIEIDNFRHLTDISIELSDFERKNLILTGKNGSGKTSVLNSLKQYLKAIENNQISYIEDWKERLERINDHINQRNINEKELVRYENEKQHLYQSIARYESGVVPRFNKEIELSSEFKKGNFIVAFFDAKRATKMVEPDAIKKIKSNISYSVDSSPSSTFIQYLVNLKAEQAFANQEGNQELVDKINIWFMHLENNLRYLFENKSLKIKFDFKSLNILFQENENKKYSFNMLSDGFSSIINILADLILRMENKIQTKTSYDVEGIVLIDEIETHLHVSLQKKILPFLVKFFPNIQFIVTTHSPFVLSSASNSVIYDLENKLRVTDLSGFSYEGIIESYFDVSQYSDLLKSKLDRFEELLRIVEKNEEEELEFFELNQYFNRIPDELSPEAKLKFYTLKNKNLGGV